jgi:hypothetical protein
VFVRRRIAYPIFLIVAAYTAGFAQNPGTASIAPRITIYLPGHIPAEVVWMRYAMYGQEGSGARISQGEMLKAEPNFRHEGYLLDSGDHNG